MSNITAILINSVKIISGSLFMFVMTLQNLQAQSKSDTLIYVGDPMCSWCYGFSPEVDKLMVMNPDLKLKLVMGGLRYNGTETMAELSGFLKDHWEEVALRTGRKFNYDFLRKSDFIYNTAPACRAVVAAGMAEKSLVWPYFKALQTAFYGENLDPTLKSTFLNIAAKTGIEEIDFSQNLNSSNSEKKLTEQLNWANTTGVRSFPTLLYKSGDQQFMLAQGFVTAEKMHERLKEIKALSNK